MDKNINNEIYTSMDGFEIECVEDVETLDAGDNAMNFVNGFAVGISIVMIT